MKVYLVICERSEADKFALEKQWDEYGYDKTDIFYDKKIAEEVLYAAIECNYGSSYKYIIHEVEV